MKNSGIYNWAVLGCGKIARKFSNDLKLLLGAKLYAAGSRDPEKAAVFARELGFERSYGSYEALVNDPEVDIIYVATPHSHHRDHTLLCLNNKKAVLCEKAFALNYREALEMTGCSRENNTFLMEAFWTKFQPSYVKAMEILKSGELGEVMMIRSDFAFMAPFSNESRLYNLELGGGSLLDIGIYPVFFAVDLFGKPQRLKALASKSPTGSDLSISISFLYKNGQMATLSSSFAGYSSVEAEFWCEKGYLRLNRRAFSPTTITVWKSTGEENKIEFNYSEGNGYQYEAQHVMDCLNAGKTESGVLTLQRSLDLMETLDRVRTDAGIFYPGHDKNLFI